MDELTLKARAKINLGLDITGRRKDGYHELRMVMQSVGLSDEVTVSARSEREIRLSLGKEKRYLPAEKEKNLAWRAAKLLADEFGILEKAGIEIHLEKHIPVAAGLAGGSADAAAVLIGVNEVFGLGISRDGLFERGLKLGADVPYCILGGTALAEGIGERLTPLDEAPGGFVLIAKPKFGISAAHAYNRYDALAAEKKIPHPDIDGIINAIKAGDRALMCYRMGNVLEAAADTDYPMIGKIRQIMEEGGALRAMMSGSGPAVFGIFEKESDALDCAAGLRGICRATYITGFFHGRACGHDRF